MAAWYDHDALKGRKLPNRGYLFEGVWAAAVAARFYKRLGDMKKMSKRRPGYVEASMKLERLPKITVSDTNKMLTTLFSNPKRKIKTRTQNDIWFDTSIADDLWVTVGVPKAVDDYLVKNRSNYTEIGDFVRASTALANSNTGLMNHVKSVAFNNINDSIHITADGLLDQRDVKADVTVTIESPDPRIRNQTFPVSCKVPGGEQFAQVSGLPFEKFVKLFGNMGMTIPASTKKEWDAIMEEFFTSGIFAKTFKTRAMIMKEVWPGKTTTAAHVVYKAMYEKMKNNFPKQGFVDYIYEGFAGGVDTELVKLTEFTKSGSKIMSGAKTLTVDDEFKNALMGLDYVVEYKSNAKYPMITIKAKGIKESIMSFRFSWRNEPSYTKGGKRYRMYGRHLLDAGKGIFEIDPRTQKIKAS